MHARGFAFNLAVAFAFHQHFTKPVTVLWSPLWLTVAVDGSNLNYEMALSSQDNPTLRIDTSAVDDDPFRSSTEGHRTSSSRARALSAVNAIPSLRLSTSPVAEKPPLSPIRPSASFSSQNASDGSQKLLNYIFTQLRNRPMPPPLTDVIFPSASRPNRKKPSISKNIAAHKRTLTLTSDPDSDEEDELNMGFSTDVTIELMEKLRDALSVAIAQKVQLFYER